jgi:hypothetical protein
MVNVGECAPGDIQFLGRDLDREFQHRRRLVDERQTMLARVDIPGSRPKAEMSLPKLVSAYAESLRCPVIRSLLTIATPNRTNFRKQKAA